MRDPHTVWQYRLCGSFRPKSSDRLLVHVRVPTLSLRIHREGRCRPHRALRPPGALCFLIPSNWWYRMPVSDLYLNEHRCAAMFSIASRARTQHYTLPITVVAQQYAIPTGKSGEPIEASRGLSVPRARASGEVGMSELIRRASCEAHQRNRRSPPRAALSADSLLGPSAAPAGGLAVERRRSATECAAAAGDACLIDALTGRWG